MSEELCYGPVIHMEFCQLYPITVPEHIAAAAAWLHGTAADRCAARMGEYGLLPSDVAAELPYLLP